MKYWVFDGNDVVGPFALQEIAARADFSANTLICAEDASEDAAGWQMASFFDSFRFNPQTGQLEIIFLPDGSSLRAATAAVPSEAPVEKTTAPRQSARRVAAQEAAILPDVLRPGAGPEKAPAPEMQAQENPSWVPPAQVTTPQEQQVAPQKKPVLTQRSPVVNKPASVPEPVRISSEKIHTQPPAPVALAHDPIDLVLPEHKAAPVVQAAPEQSKAPGDNPAKQAETPASAATPKPEPSVPEKPKEEPAPKEEIKTSSPSVKTPAHTSSLAEPETEILSTCTLPIINDILTQSDLPRLPEGEFQPVPLPAEPGFELKEFSSEEVPQQGASAPQQTPFMEAPGALPVASEENRSQPQPEEQPAPEPQTQAEPSEPPVQPAPDVVQPSTQPEPEARQPEELVSAASQPEKTYPVPQRPRKKTISEIEREFAPRPEQEDLIFEQQLLAKPTRQKAHKVLWLLFLLVLAAAGWVVWTKYHKPATALPPVSVQHSPTPAPTSAPTPAPEQSPAPAQVPVVAPKPVTAEEKALAAVQNYQLPNQKGTIAAYFDNLYQDRLSQGYTALWSVEPLHKNTYIVKYRLTKTRTEPVVYVFQADAAREQLTGALNNIALDLIGRI